MNHSNILDVAVVNCQSVLAKRLDFQNFINRHSPKIIIGCESWLSPSIVSSEIFPQQYQVYRKDRLDGYGGVFIACHNSLLSTALEYHTTSLCELVVCKIPLATDPPLIICSVYRPPNVDIPYLENLCTVLRDIMDHNPGSIVWIVGDANFPNIDWDSYSVSGNNYPVHLCETFFNFIEDCGLTQTVNFPTRYANTLDIILTNRPSLVLCCKPLSGISDHDIVYVKSNNKTIPQCDLINLWNRANNDIIFEYITRSSEQFLEEHGMDTQVDVLWKVFNEMCQKCLDMIPSRTYKPGHSPPWMNPTIKRLSHRKQRLYNLARHSKSSDAW